MRDTSKLIHHLYLQAGIRKGDGPPIAVWRRESELLGRRGLASANETGNGLDHSGPDRWVLVLRYTLFLPSLLFPAAYPISNPPPCTSDISSSMLQTSARTCSKCTTSGEVPAGWIAPHANTGLPGVPCWHAMQWACHAMPIAMPIALRAHGGPLVQPCIAHRYDRQCSGSLVGFVSPWSLQRPLRQPCGSAPRQRPLRQPLPNAL